MKKGFRLLLLLCAVTMIFVLPAMAAEVVESGKYSENISWTLDSEGLLTISGTGDMPEPYYAKDVPWYNKNVTMAVICDGVTNIGNAAFYECSSLTSITIPDSVTSIESYAFTRCKRLTSITIPDSVTSIGDAAFSGCYSLTSITIPDSVTSIGNSAFSRCSSLTSITIPSGVSQLSHSVFSGCQNLTDITVDPANACYTDINGILFNKNQTELCRYPAGKSASGYVIPNGVTSIGNYAFEDCSSLISITLSDGVTSIGDSAFEGCSSLTSITLPDGVTSIGVRAFCNCSSIASITIPDGVTSIDGSAFEGCSSLTSITLSNSVTSIEDWMFSGCSSLTSITIPDSVISIGNYAFEDCSSLTSITIPDSVTSIGDGAFKYCSSLTSITIPASVTSIGDRAFLYCGLNEVTFEGNAYMADWGYHAFYKQSFTIYYYEGTTGWKTPTWKALDGTVYNTVMIPREEPKPEIIASGECGNNATWTLDKNGLLTFSGEGNIRGYETPPQAISEAPYRAYANQINALLIEDGIEHIGSFTFFALPLDSVSIADSVLSIGQYAFSSTPITEIELPDHLTSIGFETFSQCENLEEITIPSTVVSIQSNAFDACSSLKKATFLGDAPQYFGNAFANTTEDFTIYYYEGTSGWTTPTWTSSDSTIYNTVELPREEPKPEIIASGECGDNLTWTLDTDGLLTISGTGAMHPMGGKEGCTSPWLKYADTVESLKLEDGLTLISAYAFWGMWKIDQVQLSKTVTTIDYAAFQHCNITNLVIPYGILSIGELAFDCQGLLTADISETVSYISATAFGSNMPKITIHRNNPDYCADENILYNKDKTKLIRSFVMTDDSFTIPDTVTEIEQSAFQNASLHTVIIPDTVQRIGYAAFMNCGNLTSVYFEGDIPPWIPASAFANTSPDMIFYYYNDAKDWTTPTWTAPDGTVYNTVELPRKESSTLLGDINLDGSVDIRDAEMLFLHSMLPNLYPISYKDNTDFTGDGSLDIRDAQLLFQYSMLPDVYPIH